jgi:hypothetical protein
MADKKDNTKPKFDSEMGMVIFLVILIVVVPLVISIMDINMPIKGYN